MGYFLPERRFRVDLVIRLQLSDLRYLQGIDSAGMWKVYEITAGSLKSLYRRAISGPDHPLKYRLGISISEGPERCRDHIEHGAIEAARLLILRITIE